jgi:hypothetical protein
MRLPHAALLTLPFVLTPAAGQPPRTPPTPSAPRIVVALPFAVTAGQPARLTLRGLKLDALTEARCGDPKGSVKLLGKGTKAGGYDPMKVPVGLTGDTQVEVEVSLPTGFPARTVPVTVRSADGESPAYTLIVNDDTPRVAEKEPNDGFRQAQPVPLPAVVEGSIRQPQDVDVYRFEGKAGQRVVAEVLAARFGSPVDSFLTLYDARGHVLAANDDHDGSADSRVEVTLPAAGGYYISVTDAHDQGGPAHAYRLLLQARPSAAVPR